jgi:beta-lactamase superfamily II metal-dependent hydrolase
MRRLFHLAACAFFLIAAPPLWAADAEIYFIDVGIGDAILLVAPEGQHILIDGGDQKGFAGQAVPADLMLAYLARHVPSKTLDLVVLTHSDMDHLGGLGSCTLWRPPWEQVVRNRTNAPFAITCRRATAARPSSLAYTHPPAH